MARNEYWMTLIFNERLIFKVVIDQHYKQKHPDISDELILELVKMLDGLRLNFDSENFAFEYYKEESLVYNNQPYRLVFLIPKGEDYLGIINAFRVRRKIK
jgi:hypothetical protein